MKKTQSCTTALVLLIAFIGVFALGISASPSPPSVIEQFYDPGFAWDIAGLTFGNAIASGFWYDGLDRMAWKANLNYDIGQGLYRNLTLLQPQSPGLFYTTNEICRLMPGSGNFSSFFSWLSYASYNGMVTVNGRDCDQWILPLHQGKVLIYNGLHTNNSIPVQFIFPAVSIVSTTPSNYTFTWSENIVPGPFANASSIFSVPDSCYSNGTACSPSSNGTVEVLDFYVFHDPDDFSLVNINVADLPGDAYFVCSTLRSGGLFSYFKWLSWWQIQVNTSWGQYGYCNFGSCFGGNPSLVGRESAQGFGEGEGQCSESPNNVIGSWFSLPADGLCASGQSVGSNGCSWQVVGRMKTINSTCLFSHGFANTCNSTIPLTAANKLFEQAFMSDYADENGCPPLPGPEFIDAKPSFTPNSIFQGHPHVALMAELASAFEEIVTSL